MFPRVYGGLCGAWVVALISPLALAGNGDIVMLGTLPGDMSSFPISINASGKVIGRSAGTGRTFVWSSKDGMTELAQVDSLIDVSDINNQGMIVGRTWWPGNQWQPFLWDPINGQSNLGSLGGTRSEPAAVNDGGTVVGTSVNAGYIERAFRWTAAGGMEDLGSLGGTFAAGAALDVSNTGVIVGRSDWGPHAFRWTSQAGMEDLHTLGGSRSIAYGISPNGDTIVGWADNADGYERPFRWTAQSGMQDLGALGASFGLARSVNDAGAVVGQVYGGAVGNRPVLWIEGASQPIDLIDWLAKTNASAASDWYLQEVLGINNAGMIIGYGTYYPGGYPEPLRAFVLDVSGIPGAAVPEPAAITVCATGLAIFGWMRRRQMHKSRSRVSSLVTPSPCHLVISSSAPSPRNPSMTPSG